MMGRSIGWGVVALAALAFCAAACLPAFPDDRDDSGAAPPDGGADGPLADGRPVDGPLADGRLVDGSAEGSLADGGGDGGPQDGGGADTSDGAASCGPGTMLCAGGCVSPADIHSCGSCTSDCTTLPHVAVGDAGAIGCQAGRCVYTCSAGYADCADAAAGCATSLGSSANCGACGAACTTAAPLCESAGNGGAVECTQSCPPTAPTTCMGACVDLQTNANSCGGCGAAYACAGDTTCVGGQCVGPSLALSPAQHAFGLTTVGQRSAPASFVLTNSGNGSSGTLTTSLAGTDPTAFTITTDGCNGKTLARQASCTIAVEFTPASRGPLSASLDIDGGQIFAALSASGQDSVALTVTKSGAGAGTVSGGPIDCGATCSGAVIRAGAADPIVSLIATPNAGSTFSGWMGGGCSGTGTSCNVTMSQAETVNAEFDVQTVALTVTARVFGSAAGTVSSSPAGIDCAAPCSQTLNVAPGTPVTLSTSGGPHVWWEPQCSGATCSITVNAATTMAVTFSNNNYVFVTSTTHSGNLGGLSGGDTLCAQAATSSGLPGHYVAWLTTTTTNALSRLGAARGWINTAGQPFADTVGAAGGTTGIRNGQIYYPPDFDETGTTALTSPWTGANEDGSLVTSGNEYNCDDWTSNTTSFDGALGVPSSGSGEWTYEFVNDCTGSGSLYCFGTDLNNELTVPRSVGRIAFVSTGTFTPSGGIAGADSICKSEATSASLPAPSSYLAFLASTSASAISRFDTSGTTWVRVDGIALAPSAASLGSSTGSGYLSAALTEHADGSYLTSEGQALVWTGISALNLAGSADDTCNNWSTTSASTQGALGDALSTRNWANASIYPCSETVPVYCFEQ